MTEAEIRAEAAEAERKAHDIYSAMKTARNALVPDADGSRPYIPAGFEAEVVRASELMRHARALRADADEMRAEDARAPVSPKLTVASVPAAISPQPAKVPPPPPANPVDEVEAMAAAILASDRPAPPTKCDAEVSALAAAILASDAVEDDEGDVEAAVQAILGA